MNSRHNFSAGPGALPEPVLREAQDAVGEVPGEGLSVLGISHRSGWFRGVLDEAEAHFRALLGCPEHYHILFLQGGSTQQFSQIPMTLLRGRVEPAEYLHTGYWSGKSIVEARREGPTKVLWSGEAGGFRRMPTDAELETSPAALYFHYVSNETVEGLQFHRLPGREEVLRVCDMSSDLCCRPVDVSRFALIYAHAQKNLGPSGVTVVIVREDIVEATPSDLPAMLDYRLHAQARSLYNTPPVFAIYVTMLVARWLRFEVGGLAAMEGINRRKAERLYGVLESCPGFYELRAGPGDRSLMNVVFGLAESSLVPGLLREAEACGLHGLEGHRSLPGTLRASLYNAVTLESVETLAEFLREFARRHG
jgi:phosphoserine aminotransferase